MAELAQHRWLFIRGLGREARHWRELPSLWQQHFPRSTVECIDLPGNGTLWQHRSPTQITSLIEWLHDRYSHLVPITLLGLSLGGMVAYHWMQKYPQDIRAIIMINSSLAPFNHRWQRLRPGALKNLLQALKHSGYEREAMIFDLTCANQEQREQTLIQWHLWQQQCPVSRTNLIRQLLLANSCKADSQPPKRPTLLVSGSQDRLVDPVSSDCLARQWLVPVLQHPQAGHDLPHDVPEWLISQVKQWLQSDLKRN